MRLEQGISLSLERAQSSLALTESQLNTVNPTATLQRGYAIVRHKEGKIVSSVSQVKEGDNLEIQVSDGSFDALTG
jgi:exodeoxyribonuclease VII large subunit